MLTLAIYLYIMAVGLTVAGVVTSFVQLVSGRPLGLSFEPYPTMAAVGRALLRALCGPAILMRTAWADARQPSPSPALLGILIVGAGVWSLFSGSLLLHLA